ncbi:MAG: PqiC family protein [Pseudomonadota bacterium]
MALKRLLVFSGLTAGLGACASAPEPMLYTLAPHSADAGRRTESATLIGLSEITLPSYARNPQITTATSPYRISEDDDHRWASPPSEAISDRLSAILETKVGADVLLRPYPSGVRPDLRLTISFTRLLRSENGGAELAGQYVITGLDGDVFIDRFDIFVPSDAPGYVGYMAAVSSGLDRLGGVIARQMDASGT